MKDYKQMTRKELLDLCEARDLEFNRNMEEDELIRVLLTDAFETLTKADLIAQCEALGFDVAKSAKKGEIIDALVEVLIEQPSIPFESSDDEEDEEEAEDMIEAENEKEYEPGLSIEPSAEDIMSEAEVEKIAPEFPPENPGYKDGYIEDIPEEKPKNTSSRKRTRSAEAQKARDERKKNVLKIKEVVNISKDNIDRLAYGDSSDYSPRTLRNAPKNLSIDGERLRRLRPGEQDDIELLESMKNESYIVKGEISKVLPARSMKLEHPVTGETMICVNATAVVEYGDRQVFIPSKYFFEDYYELQQDRIREFMQSRLGSEIDFKIVYVDRENPDSPIYTGSRIAAMKKKRCDYWYSERAKGKSLIQIGSIQQARVTAVSEKLMFVEIFGAEIKVEPKEVAYEYVVDCREYYTPGDIVLVRIKNVVLQDKDRAATLGYPVECEVSIKDVFEDPKKSYFDRQMWHSSFKGVVTNIAIGADNAVNIYVNDGRIDILCHLGDRITKMPEIGDTIVGKITGLNEETGRIWGIIQHVDVKRRDRKSRPETLVQKR